MLRPSQQLFQKLRYFPELNYLNRDFLEHYKDRLDEPDFEKTQSLNHFLYKEYYGGGVRKLLRFVSKCSERFGVQVHFPFINSPDLMTLYFKSQGYIKSMMEN